MKEVIFFPSKKKSIINFLICIMFFSMGCFILSFEALFSMKWFIVLAGTIFFGIGSIALIIVKRKPFLILNDAGVSIPRHPLVLWSNIRDFQIKDIKMRGANIKFLCFFLYDTTVLNNKEKQRFATKLTSHFNETLLGTPLFVHINSLSTSEEELKTLIHNFKKNSEKNETH